MGKDDEYLWSDEIPRPFVPKGDIELFRQRRINPAFPGHAGPRQRALKSFVDKRTSSGQYTKAKDNPETGRSPSDDGSLRVYLMVHAHRMETTRPSRMQARKLSEIKWQSLDPHQLHIDMCVLQYLENHWGGAR